MSEAEIALIEFYLNPAMRILEWGCGGSTAYFSQKVEQFVSVEHDPVWYARTQRPNLDIRLIPTCQNVPELPDDTYVPGYYEAFRAYIECARDWGTFDGVIIDGRARLFCAVEALQHLVKPAGYIFFHDFFRRARYAPFLWWRQPIAEIRNEQSLAIFRR
jgi:hypothetical protein